MPGLIISGSGQAAFNGTFAVASVVNSTQFTYSVANVNITQSFDNGKDIVATTFPLQSLDNAISRVTALADHLGTYAAMPLESYSYSYLGLDTIVRRSRPLNGTDF